MFLGGWRENEKEEKLDGEIKNLSFKKNHLGTLKGQFHPNSDSSKARFSRRKTQLATNVLAGFNASDQKNALQDSSVQILFAKPINRLKQKSSLSVAAFLHHLRVTEHTFACSDCVLNDNRLRLCTLVASTKQLEAHFRFNFFSSFF